MLEDEQGGLPYLCAEYPEGACAPKGVARGAGEADVALLPGQGPVVQQRVAELVVPLVATELLDAGRTKERVKRRAHG